MKLFLVASLLWIQAQPLSAQFQFNKTVTINSPVYEDLYIAGGNVIINAPVHGDLIAAGGQVQINDTVTNDILVAGGTVTFNGFAGDDIRCAGGNIHVLKNIAGDVVVTGGSVSISAGVTIGGLLASGGEVIIDGNVAGNIKTVSGNLVFNGNALKDLDCRGGKITINGTVLGMALIAATDEIIIGNQASFSGKVRYWSPGKTAFGNSIREGTAIYDPSLRINPDRWYYLGFASILGLVWYIGMVFLMIAIVQYLFGATMKKAGNIAYDAALKSLGYGIVFWIGLPIAAVLSFITVIGVPLGVILLVLYIVLALLATVITSVMAANWLNTRSLANWSYWRMVFAALGIFVVLKLLTFTPFLGWFIMALIVCISFGAIALSINWRRRPTAPAVNA